MQIFALPCTQLQVCAPTIVEIIDHATILKYAIMHTIGIIAVTTGY